MFITSVSINGFLVFDHQVEVDIPQGVTAVVGMNGAGKSTIQQAIQWCISGETRIPNDAQSVINNHSSTAKVAVTFHHNGHEYKVIRSRNKSGVSLSIDKKAKEKWVSITSGRSATALQEHIISNILGMTVDTFHALFFIDQKGDGSRFTGSKSENRRAILIDMMPELQRWDGLYKKLSDRMTESNKNISHLESTLGAHIGDLEEEQSIAEDLRESFSEQELDSAQKKLSVASESLHNAVSNSGVSGLKEKLEAAVAQRKNVQKSLELEKESLRNKYDNLSDLAEELDDLDEKEETLSDQHEQLNSVVEEQEELVSAHTVTIEKISVQCDELEEQHGTLDTKRTRLKDKLQEIEDRIAALTDSEGKCITCGSELHDEQIEILVQQSYEDKQETEDSIEKLNSEIKEIAQQHHGLIESLESEEKIVEDAGQSIKNMQADMLKIEAQLGSIPESKNLLAEKITGISGVECNVLTVSQMIDSILNDVVDEYQNFSTDVEESEEEVSLKEALNNASSGNSDLSSVEAAHAQAEQAVKLLNKKKSDIESADMRVERIEKKVASLENELNFATTKNKRIKLLREAASPKGVPSVLITNVLSDIAAESNKILATVSPEKEFLVSFSMEKLNKSGSSKPALDIFVTHDGSTRFVEALSGGEMAIVSVAIMLATVKVVNARNGNVVGSLFIDEALSSLDVEKVAPVVRAISSMCQNGELQNVMIVTHSDQVVAESDHTLSLPLVG